MNITQRYERWSGSLILSGRTKLWKCGRVWFMATVLKTVDPQGSVSSNLTASTKICLDSSGGERFAYTEDVRGSKPCPGTKLAT